LTPVGSTVPDGSLTCPKQAAVINNAIMKRMFTFWRISPDGEDSDLNDAMAYELQFALDDDQTGLGAVVGVCASGELLPGFPFWSPLPPGIILPIAFVCCEPDVIPVTVFSNAITDGPQVPSVRITVSGYRVRSLVPDTIVCCLVTLAVAIPNREGRERRPREQHLVRRAASFRTLQRVACQSGREQRPVLRPPRPVPIGGEHQRSTRQHQQHLPSTFSEERKSRGVCEDPVPMLPVSV
jgi:hypothetical protein